MSLDMYFTCTPIYAHTCNVLCCVDGQLMGISISMAVYQQNRGQNVKLIVIMDGQCSITHTNVTMHTRTSK